MKKPDSGMIGNTKLERQEQYQFSITVINFMVLKLLSHSLLAFHQRFYSRERLH